jgi:hypothetical protein
MRLIIFFYPTSKEDLVSENYSIQHQSEVFLLLTSKRIKIFENLQFTRQNLTNIINQSTKESGPSLARSSKCCRIESNNLFDLNIASLKRK